MLKRKGEEPLNRQPTSIYQAGLAAYETGDFAKAIELLSKIAEQNNLPATLARFYLGQAHLRQGVAELESGRYAVAAKHLNTARQINPDSTGLSRYLASCHAAARRFDLAAVEIERDVSAGHMDDTLPIRLAHAFAKDGLIHRAVETLRAAIHAAPNRADFRFQVGVLYASLDEYDAALSEFKAASGLDPNDAAIAEHLGLTHGALGDIPAAAEVLASAQRLAPHDARVTLLYTLAAQAAADAGHPRIVAPAVPKTGALDEIAIEALGEAIVAEPDFVEAFLCLPQSDVDREIFAMLAATLQRALERHPDYADLHVHCSRVYERLGQNDAAIQAARAALELNPRYVQALITLARLYSKTNCSFEAIDRLEQAIACGGDFPDVHFLLGEMYRELGKRIEAGAEYRRALELNADYAPARQALETVRIG